MSALIILAALSLIVLDGDTIVVGHEHVRIANIDAPELGEHARCDAERRLAEVAKRRMAELLKLGPVVLKRGDPLDGRTLDRFGRTLATVSVNGTDVGKIMIAEGLARRWDGRRHPWCD